MPFSKKRAQEEQLDDQVAKRAKWPAALQSRDFAALHDQAKTQTSQTEGLEELQTTSDSSFQSLKPDLASLDASRAHIDDEGNADPNEVKQDASDSLRRRVEPIDRPRRHARRAIPNISPLEEQSNGLGEASSRPQTPGSETLAPREKTSGVRVPNYDPDYNPLHLAGTGLKLWTTAMARMCTTRDGRRVCLHHQQNNRSKNKSKTSSSDLHSMDCYHKDGPCSFIKAVTEHMLVIKGIMYERKKRPAIQGLFEGFSEVAWETFLMGLTLQYGICADAEKRQALQARPLRGLSAFWTAMAECDHAKELIPIIQAL